MLRFLLCLIALACSAAAGAAPKVIASVVPLHSLVAAVMGGRGTPELLLKGALSEHRASFTASQLARLGDADLVFIIGDGLEAKLAQLSGSEAVNGKAFVALAAAPGIETLPIRSGGAWEADAHGYGGEPAGDHAEGVLAVDPHLWLDPENAKAMAAAIAAELAKADPDGAKTYAANALALAAEIDRTSAAITAELAPVIDKPFIVFHDAYQYFEHRFGLHAAGSITDVSARNPSAGRLKAIRDKIAAGHAICVFREPQYDGKAVDTVIEGSNARTAVLDPLGAGLQPGPSAYPQLLRNLSAALRDCLSG